MHDANGKPLAVGDKVVIPCVIQELLESTEDYCNVKVESVHGRRPDGLKEVWSAINTGQLEKVEAPADAHAALLAKVQEALPLGKDCAGACAEVVGDVAKAADAQDFIHALLGGHMLDFLKSKGLEVNAAAITPAQIQAIVKLIACDLAPMLCKAVS